MVSLGICVWSFPEDILSMFTCHQITTSQQRLTWEGQKELLPKGKSVADFKVLQASLVAQMVKNPPTMQDTWV